MGIGRRASLIEHTVYKWVDYLPEERNRRMPVEWEMTMREAGQRGGRLIAKGREEAAKVPAG